LAKGLRGYKNLWAYSRDLYEIPAFKHNTYLADLARDYGGNQENDGSFIPYNDRFWNEIDFEKKWSEPQNRRKLSKTPEEKFLRIK
jgi:putative glutathione S-transferase